MEPFSEMDWGLHVLYFSLCCLPLFASIVASRCLVAEGLFSSLLVGSGLGSACCLLLAVWSAAFASIVSYRCLVAEGFFSNSLLFGSGLGVACCLFLVVWSVVVRLYSSMSSSSGGRFLS